MGKNEIAEKTAGAVKNAHGGINSYFQKLDSDFKVFAVTALLFVLVMGFAAAAVFFSVMRGQERVLVPDVTGKWLAEALIEMQEKELYPKIQLRYSNAPGDKGLILYQNPEPGAVVKAGRRIDLEVSRGVVIDELESYVGQNIDDVRIRLQSLFSGSTRPLIVLGQPLYEPDIAEAGTVLRQNPPEGTEITDPVTLTLVVSRGPQYESTKIPYLVGMGVSDVLQQITRTKLIFDFTSRPAAEGEKAGTVVDQDAITAESARNYSRIKAVFAFDSEDNAAGAVSGLFTAQLPEYPYAISARIDVRAPDGGSFTLVSFNHTGGNFSVPYTVPRGSELALYIAGRETAKQTARGL
ncbi:MAG: PASTA domain-containing protein [Treponemataceae bacterium]|nr:MAG: PASTA domain-containing protein [Treponemataceae bacterium]